MFPLPRAPLEWRWKKWGVVTIIIVGIRDIVGGSCGVVTMAVIVVEYR